MRRGEQKEPGKIIRRETVGPIKLGFEADAGGVWLAWKLSNATRDFMADLKAIPTNHRFYHKDKKIWWVSAMCFPALADFLLAHFGVDLTPERNNPIQPTIELLGHVDD